MADDPFAAISAEKDGIEMADIETKHLCMLTAFLIIQSCRQGGGSIKDLLSRFSDDSLIDSVCKLHGVPDDKPKVSLALEWLRTKCKN